MKKEETPRISILVRKTLVRNLKYASTGIDSGFVFVEAVLYTLLHQRLINLHKYLPMISTLNDVYHNHKELTEEEATKYIDEVLEQD